MEKLALIEFDLYAEAENEADEYTNLLEVVIMTVSDFVKYFCKNIRPSEKELNDEILCFFDYAEVSGDIGTTTYTDGEVTRLFNELLLNIECTNNNELLSTLATKALGSNATSEERERFIAEIYNNAVEIVNSLKQ